MATDQEIISSTESEWRDAITNILTITLRQIRAIGRNGGDIDGRLVSQLADLCHNLPTFLAGKKSLGTSNPLEFIPQITVAGILEIGQSTPQRYSIQEHLINQLPEPYRTSTRQRALQQASD